MLVRIERLRRLRSLAVILLLSELATDLVSSDMVSCSTSWNRTTGSLTGVVLSESCLNGWRKIGEGFSLTVGFEINGAENADRAKGDRLGIECLRCVGSEYS